MGFCVGVCFELLRFLTWIPVILGLVLLYFVLRWVFNLLRNRQKTNGPVNKL